MDDPIQAINYEDYHRLLHHRCNWFGKKTGADPDLLITEAHLAYVHAIRNWQPGKLPFDSYLSMCVDRALRQFWKKWSSQPCALGQKENKHGNHTDAPKGASDPPARPEFDIGLFMREVSEDAQEAIRVALEKGQGNTKHWLWRKKAVRTALMDLGWTAGRVIRCFAEIKEALTK